MKKILIFISIISLSNGFFKAQEVLLDEDSLKNSDLAANYRAPLKDLISVRLDLNTDIRTIKFSNPAPLKPFSIAPNQALQTRITVGYEFLQVAIQFAPKIGNDEEEKGNSEIKGLEANIMLGKFNQQFYYRKTDGYYLENSDLFRQEINAYGVKGKYALLPDFSSTQLGSETFYFLNGDRYSASLHRYQRELQLKSVGTITTYLGLHYTDVNGKNQNFDFLKYNLPANQEYPYRSKSYYAVAGVGYAYNYVFGKGFYATGMVVPATGIQHSIIEYPDNYLDQKKSYFTIGGITEASFGYNSRKWFWGVFGNYTYYTNPGADVKLAGSQSYIMLFAGYRFEGPKWLKRQLKNKK